MTDKDPTAGPPAVPLIAMLEQIVGDLKFAFLEIEAGRVPVTAAMLVSNPKPTLTQRQALQYRLDVVRNMAGWGLWDASSVESFEAELQRYIELHPDEIDRPQRNGILFAMVPFPEQVPSEASNTTG